MKKIVLATANKGKIREIRDLLADLEFSVLVLEDFPDLKMPPEDGLSFKENALIKARYAAKFCGLTALADDSGLEVRGLGGAPGIRSARYAGVDSTDGENIEKLIKETAGMSVDERRARFVCVLSLVEPTIAGEGCSDGGAAKEFVFEGTLDGVIIDERRGSGGFGYDPIFFIPEFQKTAAELTRAEKNRISHRGKALGKLRAHFQGFSKD